LGQKYKIKTFQFQFGFWEHFQFHTL
jgi:hypothetical protein